MRAAFIGSDPRIAELASLAIHLRWPEVTPIVVASAVEALDMISRESLDVVLLHPDIGDNTLAEFIRDMRGLTDVPLLVLSDWGDETEVVTALEAGADDYVCLPCGLTEAGLPIGLQIAGLAFDEAGILAVARAYEAAGDWQGRRPPAFA